MDAGENKTGIYYLRRGFHGDVNDFTLFVNDFTLFVNDFTLFSL